MNKGLLILGRLVLFSLGIGLSACGSRLALAPVQAVITTEAFINGEILTIAAPIDGQVAMAMPLRSGLPIPENQPLLALKNTVVDPWLRDAGMDLVTERSRLNSMIHRLQNWDWSQPSPSFKSNPQVMERSAAVQLADQAVQQAAIAVQSAESEANLAASKYARLQQLVDEGAIARLTAQEAQNEWHVKQNQVEMAQIELQKKQLEAQQMRSLLSVTEPWLKVPSDAPKPDRKAYQDLYQEAQILETRIAAHEQAIVSTQSEPRLMDRVVPSPVRGVLWEVLTRPKEEVTVGQPLLKLLNCDRLWVDAFVSLDDLPRIKVGNIASIKPYGSDRQLDGKVVSIRSNLSGFQQLGKDAAINPPDLAGRQVAQLRIELNNVSDLLQSEGTASNFCHVGQVSEVSIPSQVPQASS